MYKFHLYNVKHQLNNNNNNEMYIVYIVVE